MRKLMVGAVLVVAAVAVSSPGAAEPSRQGETTINLRTCVVSTTGSCASVDGVTVCLTHSPGSEGCFQTEDGEMWFDSQPHGRYGASLVPADDLELLRIECTASPARTVRPCRAMGNAVSFVAHRDDDAVTVLFVLGTGG